MTVTILEEEPRDRRRSIRYLNILSVPPSASSLPFPHMCIYSIWILVISGRSATRPNFLRNAEAAATLPLLDIELLTTKMLKNNLHLRASHPIEIVLESWFGLSLDDAAPLPPFSRFIVISSSSFLPYHSPIHCCTPLAAVRSPHRVRKPALLARPPLKEIPFFC